MKKIISNQKVLDLDLNKTQNPQYSKSVIFSKNRPQNDTSKLPSLIDVDLNVIVKRCLKQRSNAVDMMKKLDFIELLQLLALDQENQTLIPLAIMKAKQKQIEEKINQKNKKY